ncbi:MAG: hypothetical protein ACQEW0_09095 [Pseudomonadota bacterium]
MPELLQWPADAPAQTAWLECWRHGLDLPHPLQKQTAADWLARLTDDQLKQIHQLAQEG